MKIVFLFLLLLFALPANAADNDFGVSGDDELTDSVTILAASSFSTPLSELALIYSQRNNADINTVYESSGDLVRQIDNGDPADIIIFSGDEWMNNLKQRGLIDKKSIRVLGKNSLFLVGSNQVAFPQKLPLNAILDYINNRMLIVMANPADNYLGRLSRESLVKANRWEKFEKMTVLAPSATKTTDLIIKSQTAGIVYASEYYLRQDKLTLLAKIPDNFHKPITYRGAVLIGKDMEKSRDFLKFLNSDEAKKIFKKYGFIIE